MKDSPLELRTVDMHAEIDLGVYVWGYRYGTTEYWDKLEKELENEAKDLEIFLRDHRSRDSYGITVIRERAKICKFCGEVYPEDYSGEIYCCSKAQEMVDEQKDYPPLTTREGVTA